MLLFGYQRCGLLTVRIWSNRAGASGPVLFAGSVRVSCAVATTAPEASTIWVVSVTGWSDEYSFRTLVCTRMVADASFAVTVAT
ncbi:Uncharacterised protein [Burkholderia gladioli]|nr:Uncharacterised protein [Burkholderia gladioli]